MIVCCSHMPFTSKVIIDLNRTAKVVDWKFITVISSLPSIRRYQRALFARKSWWMVGTNLGRSDVELPLHPLTLGPERRKERKTRAPWYFGYSMSLSSRRRQERILCVVERILRRVSTEWRSIGMHRNHAIVDKLPDNFRLMHERDRAY